MEQVKTWLEHHQLDNPSSYLDVSIKNDFIKVILCLVFYCFFSEFNLFSQKLSTQWAHDIENVLNNFYIKCPKIVRKTCKIVRY